MAAKRAAVGRRLPGGIALHNRLLAALPAAVYGPLSAAIRISRVKLGQVLHDDGVVVRDVYFPNGGVYSVTNEMRDGRLVEVATVGDEGMLGVSVFLGDKLGTGRTLLQVPDEINDGLLPTMTVAAFVAQTAAPGPFRDVVARYAQANFLQVMQCTACNALHGIEQRCCRWLLQTHDRVSGDEFTLKHEFLAAMLGTTRPSVTLVMGTLQKAGLISNHYGRIRILDRENLEAASCECYDTIVGHYQRLIPDGVDLA
jgi:CRP-like cAMP-binding protein